MKYLSHYKHIQQSVLFDGQVKVDAKTKTYLDEYKAEKRKELKRVIFMY